MVGKLLLLMGSSGCLVILYGLHWCCVGWEFSLLAGGNQVLTPYLDFLDTNSAGVLKCLCIAWWGWKSRFPTWLLLVMGLGTVTAFSVMFVWNSMVVVKKYSFLLDWPFLVLWVARAGFFRGLFCFYLLVFLGSWLLHLQVWDIQSKRRLWGTYHSVRS